mgnify:CR=1 FL=1
MNENGGCLHKIKSKNFTKKNVAKKTLSTANGRGKTIVNAANKPGELPPFGFIFLKSANCRRESLEKEATSGFCASGLSPVITLNLNSAVSVIIERSAEFDPSSIDAANDAI